MAISQGLLLWFLVNVENFAQFHQQNRKTWRRSLDYEDYSESCPSKVNRDLNSFLWVMDRNPPVYFFGTIHVPYTKVWDHIPFNSKRAFKTASSVYFELDMTDKENLKTLERCKSLPKGVKLRDVLPSKMYRRVKTHLSYIRSKLSDWITFEQKIMGVNPLRMYQQLTQNWHKKRPIWLMLLLDKLTEYHVKLLAQGLPVLDTYLMREALSNHKTLGSIETVEEQCDALNKLNNSQVIQALNQTLMVHEKIRHGKEKLPVSTKQLIYHYNCGDLNEVLFSQDMANIANTENVTESSSIEKKRARKFEEYMKEELIFKRNKKMAKRIENILKEQRKRSMIFALGAGHFLGNRSVISLLQSRGYTITHLNASDPLPRYGSKRKGKHCKKRQAKKRKGQKQKRKRYRSRRNCKNDQEIPTKRVTTPKRITTTCTSCTTRRIDGLKEAFFSTATTQGCRKCFIVITTLVLANLLL